MSLVAGIPAGAIALASLPALPQLLACGVVYSVVWLLLARWTKRISDEDWRRLLGVMPFVRPREQG